jgi:oxygen-independent coproporphyrinogen-3 oxidase
MATQRHRKPENFLEAVARNGHGLVEERPLGTGEQASEALLMGLRLREGVDLGELAKRLHIPRHELIEQERLTFLESIGLAWREGDRIGVTPQGMPVLDAVLGELVPAALATA